ncbi:hypothetical protein OsI_15754 [Oryza sativa Indica Group]|uniref:Uncharacterized protein n=1 Tax=Oryza sativa subsp. indica TaxID=39946 RepID=A2XT17_ORYSI|nr:hypothetical protein OsI_15754 [Oryza sativa Indica Group]
MAWPCGDGGAAVRKRRRGNEPAGTALAGGGASAGWLAGRRRRRQRVQEVRLARAEASEARPVAAEATVVRGGAVEVPVQRDEAARRGGSGRCGGRRGQWPGEARPVAARRDWPAEGAGAVVPTLRRRFWMAMEQWYMCGRSTGGGRQVKTQPGLGRTGIDDVRASFPS